MRVLSWVRLRLRRPGACWQVWFSSTAIYLDGLTRDGYYQRRASMKSYMIIYPQVYVYVHACSEYNCTKQDSARLIHILEVMEKLSSKTVVVHASLGDPPRVAGPRQSLPFLRPSFTGNRLQRILIICARRVEQEVLLGSRDTVSKQRVAERLDEMLMQIWSGLSIWLNTSWCPHQKDPSPALTDRAWGLPAGALNLAHKHGENSWNRFSSD